MVARMCNHITVHEDTILKLERIGPRFYSKVYKAPVFLCDNRFFVDNRFFKESSEEEREHAEKLVKYQNICGGGVVLYPIVSPPSKFDHVEKGDALYVRELWGASEVEGAIEEFQSVNKNDGSDLDSRWSKILEQPHSRGCIKSLEKLVNEKLLNLHSVADRNNDPQLADFIESEFLDEQSEWQQLICEILRATPEAASADAAVQTARLASKVPSKDKSYT
ncbi:Dysferlin [Trifolium repens]|nr:Dysferlin [Trifolium repens]